MLCLLITKPSCFYNLDNPTVLRLVEHGASDEEACPRTRKSLLEIVYENGRDIDTIVWLLGSTLTSSTNNNSFFARAFVISCLRVAEYTHICTY